jgi:predicted aspartyl protease
MRIQGYFGQFDAPYVKARIICKQLGIDEVIIFLVDLGAAVTLISPPDAERLGIPYHLLTKIRRGVSGVGGRAKTYLMPNAQLIFKTETGNFKASINRLFVLRASSRELSASEKLIPSLLGRDFLNQIALLTDKRQDLVLITDEVLTV